MLKQALAGRDDLSLLKILRYLHKHIAHVTYMPVLIEVTNIVSQLYDFSTSTSDKNQKAIEKLQRTINEELQFQVELMKTKGVIEVILAAASVSTSSDTNYPNTNNASNGAVIATL